MPEKVLDPLKQVTDPVLLKELQREGVDPEGVEFYQDYASRSLGERHSPYAKFYRDLNSRKKWMVVSGLPMVDGDGNKIECGWRVAGINYFSEKNNLFRAKVQGLDVELIVRNDQPDGRKANDRLSYKPQLSLNGVPILTGASTLLPIDPVNPNYLENTLEWDYGICKRRLRVIEGSVLGSWVFASKPSGEVRIKYNQIGDYKLKLGQFRISDDEELVKPEDFDELAKLQGGYPVTISDTATYYPDANPETTSVDGALSVESNLTWANIWGHAGEGSYESSTGQSFARIASSTTTNQYFRFFRFMSLFDTSPFPDTAVISAATLSLYGSAKVDNAPWNGKINIYSAAPDSNTALVAGDFVYTKYGTTPYSSDITYANFSITGYNAFALNAAGIAAISKTGISKFSCREVVYDVANSAPSWAASKDIAFNGYFSEQGNGYKPKLVVTYTSSVPYSESSSVLLGEKVVATRLVNYPRTAPVLEGIMVSATRASTYIRNAPLLIGNLVGASRSWGVSVISPVLLGIVTSASRIGSFIRNAPVAIGELVSAIRVVTFTIVSPVLVGIGVVATKAWGITTSSAISVGLLVSAVRTATFTRASSVLSGVLVSATRVTAITRTASVLVGEVVTATRLATYTRAASAISGILVSATRTLAYIRASAVISGIAVSASRIYGGIRTASVSVGVMVLGRLWTKIKRLVSIVGTNRDISTIGDNRVVGTVGTNRDVSIVGDNRVVGTTGINRDIEEW